MATITTCITTQAKRDFLQAGHCFNATVTPTCTVGSGSTSVTSVSSMTGISVGMAVTGTSIAAGSVVAKITSTTALTLSTATTGAISGGTISVTGDSYKMALIKPAPSTAMDSTITNYSQLSTDEITGTGYTAGGVALTNVTATTSGTTALINWSPNPQWTASSFTAAGAMIYNTSIRANGLANQVVAIYDFGGSQTVTSGQFSVLMPVADASNAIVRIS